MTWTISKISVQGVKGVLDRAGDFSLGKKSKHKSIAIFGRNAQGKSGYADAIEYLFSHDGAVEHLGKGSADSEQGGKHALPHVLAEEKGITPQIEAEFINNDSGERIYVSRLVLTGRSDTRPIELEPILEKAPAYRILRQHDLRRFVVDMTPGQKFEEFARWIGLRNATTVLKHLTTTEGTLRDTSVDREITERLTTIDDYTSGEIKSFDLPAIFNWCSNFISLQLGQTYSISRTDEFDNGIAALRAKRDAIANQTQAAKSNLEKVNNELTQPNGYLQNLRETFKVALQVEKRRNEIQQDASESVFQEIWNSSKEFLETNQVDNCPTCQTPWDKTSMGSQDAVVVVLNKSLEKLSSLTEQNNELQKNIQVVKTNLQQVETRLTEISTYANTLMLSKIKDKADDLHARSAFYQQTLESAEKGKKGVEFLLSDCLNLVDNVIPNALKDLQAEDKKTSSTNIDNAITRLQVFKDTIERLEALTRQQESIKKIEQEFNKIANRIRSEIKTVADNAVDALRSDVQKIYKKIHPGETVPNVFINLNTEEKTLTIRVNFHSNERIVPPGGYLSEAQINTLGLALFLSSVRLFNKSFPFVFLDDIVSSYDADNRARIVDVLAEDMQDFQIFLTTHDERFYSHLKGRLEKKNWIFERISGYDFESGPQRETDNLRPDQIGTLIKQGNAQIAGNAVRQYLEEWFDAKCEKYVVYTPHRRGMREYKRTLFDYWEPYLTRIKSSKGDFKKRILDSKVFERLNGSLMPIINYYSHNQANPYEWPSMGDVEYLWSVFQEFEMLFNCASCDKSLKFDFNENRFYCTCGLSIFPS